MRQLRAWIVRLIGLAPGGRREREFEEELESHLQMHVEDNLRAGMTPEQARRDAILKLGGVESTRQIYRERNTVPFLEHLLQDIRFALRQLAKQPGFTFTAVLILALGLGASLAIFGFVDAALIKPLPYRNPSRLVHVTESVAMIPRANLSYLDYLDWKRLNTVFSSLEVYGGGGYLLRTPSGADMVPAARVSDGFFRTLGVQPVIGRDFHEGEDSPGVPRTVLLGYTTWLKRFGGRRDVLGETVTLSGTPHTVIGVLPRDFQFAPRGSAEIWTTIASDGACERRRSCHNLEGVARLSGGTSVQMALANMTSIAQQLEREYPDSNRGQGAAVAPLSDVIVGDIRPVLLVLLGGAVLLLVIACVNVASLVLVRAESRRRELAVRSALGASTARLACQFVTEGLVLVAAGTALGLASASWAMQLLMGLIPADMLSTMPYLSGLGLNVRVISCAGVLGLLAVMLFSVTPTLRVSFSEMREGIAGGSRGSAGTTWRRLGSRLVVVELATAMVLLAGAGLLGKSLYHLLNVDLGFNPGHLAVVDIAAPISDATAGEAGDERSVARARQIVSRIAALPGVESVGITSTAPVRFNGNTTWIRFVGRPYNGEHNEVNFRTVSAAYFTTLQARLLAGRYFVEADDRSRPGVAIINRTLARQYFPGEDPVGRQIGDTNLSPDSITEIVGVVDDIREGALDAEIWPAVYYPFNQSPDSYFSVFVRTSQDEQSILPALGAAIRGTDPDVGTRAEATMRGRIHDSQRAYLHRSSTWLVGGFAVLALLLGIVGLYGVIAYSVSQRTREIGVRMALGAGRSTVYQLIVREAGGLAAVGIIVGLACAVAAATLMRELLFGTPPWDLPTLAAVSAVLAAAALLASYFPARRAASVDPIEALRTE